MSYWLQRARRAAGACLATRTEGSLIVRRKYTVDEIDRMRLALIGRHPIQEFFSWRVGLPPMTVVAEHQRRVERRVLVEDELRTLMLNGTDPDEICRAK